MSPKNPFIDHLFVTTPYHKLYGELHFNFAPAYKKGQRFSMEYAIDKKSTALKYFKDMPTGWQTINFDGSEKDFPVWWIKAPMITLKFKLDIEKALPIKENLNIILKVRPYYKKNNVKIKWSTYKIGSFFGKWTKMTDTPPFYYEILPKNPFELARDNLGINTEYIDNNRNLVVDVFNTSFGMKALRNNSEDVNESKENVAVGYKTLNKKITGKYNTAIGAKTMINSNGTNNILANTVVGDSSMQNVTGNNNNVIGYNSGNNIKKGNDNILIGSHAKTSLPTSENEIVIGNYGEGHGNNKATLGNKDTRNIQGKKDFNLGSKEKNFKTLYTNKIGVFHQDKRDKTILRDDNINLSSLKKKQLPKGTENKKYIKIDSKGNMTLVDLATILKNIK